MQPQPAVLSESQPAGGRSTASRVAAVVAGVVLTPFLFTAVARLLPGTPVSFVVPLLVVMTLAAAVVAVRRRWWPMALGIAVGAIVWGIVIFGLLLTVGRGLKQM